MRRLLGIIVLTLLARLPALGQTQFSVLVLAIADKYHYEYVPVARESFWKLSLKHNFALTWSNDAKSFDSDLSQYAAVVLLNTTPDSFTPAEKDNLVKFVHNGGGVVVVHRGTIARNWDFYERLIGRHFIAHPYIQTAVINVVDREFPGTMALPPHWLWTDEWYEFGPELTPGLHTVMEVDESTYDVKRTWADQKTSGMGVHHPIAWYHEFEGGRVYVTAIGHTAELYRDSAYLQQLFGGIYWAAFKKTVRSSP